MEAASLQPSLRHSAIRCGQRGDVTVDVCTESLKTHSHYCYTSILHIRALADWVRYRRDAGCLSYFFETE